MIFTNVAQHWCYIWKESTRKWERDVSVCVLCVSLTLYVGEKKKESVLQSLSTTLLFLWYLLFFLFTLWRCFCATWSLSFFFFFHSHLLLTAWVRHSCIGGEKRAFFFAPSAFSSFFFYFVLVPFFFSAILDAARSSYSSFLSCSCFTY